MDWRYNTIWHELLPEGEYKSIICGKNNSPLEQHLSGLYFFISNYKTKGNGFEYLKSISTAKFLFMVASNIKSLQSISNLGPIKRLEINYCLKFQNDEGISGLNKSIEWLHINQANKYSPSKELFELNNLRVLCLNSCGPLENLQFLKHFPKLLDFRFVDTNVIDGDLTPLFDHPSLVSVGCMQKRHYNVKQSVIDEYFLEKKEKAKEYICKGEYKTYRYKCMEIGE